jgi:uncharacterized protein YecE (DUF72 family)
MRKAMTSNANAASTIACGIAGWSYEDWEGFVYPPGTRDKLRYIARFFDVIEINSSFYRIPNPATALSWLKRTEDLPHFTFTAKINQEVTHRGRLEQSTTLAFGRSFGPMAEAERLSHLLAQFRYDYADCAEARRYLRAIRDSYGNITNLTLELRHKSWAAPEALDYLRALDVTVANLDYPTANNSFNLRSSGIGDHAYLRLHGRNAKAWFSKSSDRDETYNYLYGKEELDDIASRAMEIGQLSKSMTLIANNHYRGKEAANALEIKAMISGERVDTPPTLLHHYPDLKAIATPGEEFPF